MGRLGGLGTFCLRRATECPQSENFFSRGALGLVRSRPPGGGRAERGGDADCCRFRNEK